MTVHRHIQAHLDRVKDGMDSVYGLANLSDWITKHTYLEGANYSFKDHEYQKYIIDDMTPTLFVNKCAQVGLSEIFGRWGMAACATQANFTLIWTFPSTTDAEKFCKTRLDPMLQSSPALRHALSRNINSVELKQFNDNSFSYIRGTISETGALSVPADLLIHDEYDRSDMANISAYVSRLQHKPTKMRRIFSTPTIKKYGISKESDTSRRYKQVWTCSHCNETFIPDYEQNVVVPGWDRPKKEINKNNLKDIRWREAKLLCPGCGLEPSTDLKYREFVLENPGDQYDSKTIFVAPFCLPRYLTPAYLVKVSTEFDKWSEFVNQSLGLTAEDEQESLTETNIRKVITASNVDFRSSNIHFLGADMGITCHITIGRVDHATGKLILVHRERVPSNRFTERRAELMREFKCIVSVHDVYPYTDTIQRIVDFDPNAYGAIYSELNSSASHTIREQVEEAEEGKLNVRCVNINRSVALDELMHLFKNGGLVIPKTDDIEEFVSHMMDMKRVQKFDKHGGIIYRWVKTSEVDHWHHSLLYLYMASKLAATFSGSDVGATSLVRTLRIQPKILTGREGYTRLV